MIKFKNTFFGSINDGELMIENMGDWSARIHQLEGEQITIKLDKRRKVRSLNQNNYMHMVFQIIGDELGYTTSEIKGVIKYLFKVKHTSELSTVECEELMAKIRQWASIDLGIYVPAPNEDLPNFMI